MDSVGWRIISVFRQYPEDLAKSISFSRSPLVASNELSSLEPRGVSHPEIEKSYLIIEMLILTSMFSNIVAKTCISDSFFPWAFFLVPEPFLILSILLLLVSI